MIYLNYITISIYSSIFFLYNLYSLLMPFTVEKVQEIEAHLANNPYLSEGGLPGVEDARVFLDFKGVVPEVAKTPNVFHWYWFVNSFSADLLKSWVDKANQKPEDKTQKPKNQGKKKQHKKEQKKEEKAETKPADDDDLFGDDDTATKVPPPPKPVVGGAKKKEKPIAKSIVVFEVKVYDQETNLDDLAKKILKREIPGLVWNNEPKKLDVAYGMQKLQLGCVIEDDKVLTDDIFDPIEQWEEVQSVDMTSMQKL